VVLDYVVWPWPESKYVTREHCLGEKIKGQHEAIVDEALFDKVQAILNQKGPPHPQTKKFYVYRGLMKCGDCNWWMSPYISGGIKYYYSNHLRGGRCPQTKGVVEEVATEQFTKALARFKFPKDLFDWVKEMLRSTYEDRSDTIRAECKRLKDEDTRIEAKMYKAFSKAMRETFDAETIKRNVGRLRERQSQIRAQLIRLTKETGRHIDDGLMILELVQDLPKAFDQATEDQRHRMLKLIFEKVVVKEDHFAFYFNEPFASLYARTLENPKEWLLGQDSNLQPIGYKHPKISSGLGLSHHPSQNLGEGVGRFLRALAAEYELAL